MSRCKYCDRGYRLTGDYHTFTESLSPPTIVSLRCVNRPKFNGCKKCGSGPCQYGLDMADCSVEKAA